MEPTQTLLVTGIARSGLTLTMQMLYAGGFPCEGPNPSFEPHLMGEIPWPDVKGRAVKVVDLEYQVPPHGDYRVIRLRRDVVQQAKSINKWNNVFGQPSLPVPNLIATLRRDYRTIDAWLERYPRLLLDFETLCEQPREAAQAIADFVGRPLDIERMVGCLIPRSPKCHRRMLELELPGV